MKQHPNQAENIKNSADTLARDYNTNFRQNQQARQEILNYAKEIFFSAYEDGIIVDAGCGNGTLTNELAELIRPLKVIGIDISEEMITEAKKIYINNCEFYQCNANEISKISKIPLKAITVFNAWTYISKVPNIIEEFQRSLDDDGIVFISGATREDLNSQLLHSILKNFHFHDESRESSDELKSRFESGGFKIIGEDSFFHVDVFGKPEELKNFVSGKPYMGLRLISSAEFEQDINHLNEFLKCFHQDSLICSGSTTTVLVFQKT